MDAVKPNLTFAQCKQWHFNRYFVNNVYSTLCICYVFCRKRERTALQILKALWINWNQTEDVLRVFIHLSNEINSLWAHFSTIYQKKSILKSFFLSVLLTLKQKNTSFPQQPSHEIIWCVWLHNNIRITFQAENEFYNESDMQKDFIAYLKFIYIFWCWVIMPRQNVLRRIGRKCWIIKSKLIVFMINS